MKREIRLGRWAGLHLTLLPSAVMGLLGLWIVLVVIGLVFLHLPVGEAILGGLAATVLHWISETLHQWGHAQAAKRVGYPMTGIRYWGVLGTSIYPIDEPSLPGHLHIRRALGGPIASLALGALCGLIALSLSNGDGLLFWLALFTALDNLVVLGLGAFVPLGFNDGSTILTWWGRRAP
jgi:hypothetical protein